MWTHFHFTPLLKGMNASTAQWNSALKIKTTLIVCHSEVTNNFIGWQHFYKLNANTLNVTHSLHDSIQVTKKENPLWLSWVCALLASCYQHSENIIHSHGRARVFKRRRSKSMEKAKIRPLAMPKPLNQSSQKLAGVITSWIASGMQNLVAIGSGVSAPQIRDFAVPFDVTSFFFVFLGSSIRLQPTPLNGFLCKMRQKTSFRARKCLLGSRLLYLIFIPLNFQKKRHFGNRFWLDLVFLRPKIALTWGCSNIKLLLIVIVAP